MTLDSKLAAIRDATREDIERIEMIKDLLLLLDGISAGERRQISATWQSLEGVVAAAVSESKNFGALE